MPLDPTLPIVRHVHDQWGTEDGLPQEMVLSLAQTPDGYLWIGTEEGVVRFDGLEFDLYDRETSPAIIHNHVSSLLAARDGALWIGTMGGITVLKNGVARSFPRKDGYPGEVWALLQRRDGTIWAATSTGIWSWNGLAFRRYGVEHGLPSAVAHALAEDDSGTLWAGTAGGLARFDGSRFVPLSDPNIPEHPVSAIVPDGNRLWIGTKGGGVTLLAGAASRRFTERDGLGGDFVLSMIRTSTGAIWVGSNGAPMTRIAGGRLETFGRPEERPWAYLEDREGNLWFGGLGLHRLKTAKIHTYTTDDGLSSNTILPIVQDRSGTIWIGTAGGGLNRHRDGRFESFGPDDGLPGAVILALLAARDGTLWISTNRGLARWVADRITPFDPPEGIAGAPVLAFHEDADGTIWFASQGAGVWSMRGDAIRHITTADGLPSDAVYDIHRDSRGTLWFASSAGLALLDGNRCRVVTPELIDENIGSIREDAEGDLWIATWSKGLALLRSGKVHIFRERDGLQSDTLHAAIPDARGTIWMTSNRGISSLPKSAFLDFARGRSKRLRPTVFGRSEGMRNRECNGGVDPAGALLADGRIWIPTMGGIAEVDAARIVPNRIAPLVTIESVQLDGAHVDLRSGIRMKAARSRLAIRYNALSLYAPEGLTFRYRLEGFDDTWHDAGTRRAVEYTNLPPGDFRFVVMATNSDGIEGRAPASFAFTVVPRFVQTRLFYGLIAFGVLLVALGAHRWRTAVLHRREQYLLEIVEAKTRAEESIRRSERHFRSLIENASDMILVLDDEGRIHYTSPSVERLLGYGPADLDGKNLLDFVHEDDGGEVFRALLRHSRTAPATVPFRFLRHDGSWCAMEAIGRRVDEEEASTIVVNCRDVTERTLLESQLEQASRLSSLGRLAATVAHEFNNVLMGILPFAERMSRVAKDEGVEHILRAVKRGKRITDEILRYTRPADPVMQPLRAADWIADLNVDLRALLGPSIGIRFHLDDPALGMLVDVTQINQVIANLAANARDAMGGRGTIDIEFRACGPDRRFPFGMVEHPEQRVHLIVRDDGEGIPPDALPHIFEPLFTTKRSGGTGLGLAVAHQIIHRHGGQIFVESEPGQGTAFHLFLPRTDESTVRPAAEPRREAQAPVGLRRVLLVEDDPSVAAGIAMILESEGVDVMTVERGEEVCAAVESFSPDAVVLDMWLPDMDGVAVYERIARRWPALPVIFSTGHGDESKLGTILANPRVGFLLKPYDAATLLREIREHMAVT